MTEPVTSFIDALKRSKYCVALTGAGVSTLSGIRDFRGKNGIYKEFNADTIFDLHYFRQDPSYYYRMTKDFIYNLDDKRPGLVHTELARLESIGIVKALITQNIDLLHTRAGSKKVIELHGSPRLHRCLDCGSTFTYEEIAAEVNKGTVPSCSKCRGIVKPDITFFGEMLDSQLYESAVREATKADLMLALGTSLVVQPAASLPLYTLRNEGALIIVNDMETPLDSYASCRFDDLVACFEAVRDRI